MVINMRQPILCFCILSLLAISCDKDKLATKPSIKLKSKSADVIEINGGPLIFQFDYADKEGDVSNDFYVEKIRLNERVTQTVNDSFHLAIPDMGTDRPDGQIEIRLYYNEHLKSALNPGNPPEPDTLNFRFALRDKAENTSDTISAGPIIIKRSQ